MKQKIIYFQNKFYAQEFHKKINDNGIKPGNYAVWEKIWVYSKYIKKKKL